MTEDDNDNDDEREPPPAVSRIDRAGDRRYRVLNRPTGRYRNRDRFQRRRRQIPIAELIGRLLEHHGLTDEVRKRAVCLYWPEIVGERIASKTFPVSFAEGVLQVSASNSSWVASSALASAASAPTTSRSATACAGGRLPKDAAPPSIASIPATSAEIPALA